MAIKTPSRFQLARYLTTLNVSNVIEKNNETEYIPKNRNLFNSEEMKKKTNNEPCKIAQGLRDSEHS